MKKNFLFLLLTLVVLSFLPACKKAEYIKTSAAKPEKVLLGFAGGNNSTLNRIAVVHLYSDTVYTLSASEPFWRDAGEQLIIDEGTVIRAAKGSEPITIKPGGIILATGTAAHPIVFTSDEAAGNQYANWGGIVIQGNSLNNAGGAGIDPADFSGSLQYVRIEFAGLVLNSVGNKTKLENIQVSYTGNRPSFEISGGTFDARNLVSYACGGPADFYITRGYTGRMQQVLAYRHPYFGSKANNPPYNTLCGVFIENNPDNPAGALPNTFPVISNLTVIGPHGQNGSAASYADTTIRSAALVTTNNALFHIRNSILMGFPQNGWYLDDSLTARHLNLEEAQLTYSSLHCADTASIFYLQPGKYSSFGSTDFYAFMMNEQFKNRIVYDVADFKFKDLYSYDNGPDPQPAEGSPLFSGANFEVNLYDNNFFNKVNFIGAVGPDNWLVQWVSFTPLKTNYNNPE